MTTQQHADQIREAFGRELAEIRDEGLRDKVLRTWVRAMELSGSTDLYQDLFFIHEVSKPGLGVEHVRVVSQLALAIADTLVKTHGVSLDRDIVAAGALLHDVGKLLETAPAGRHPLAGPNVRHAFSGVYLATEEGLPPEVLHIIAYHSLEGQRYPRSFEGELIYRADYISVEAVCRRDLGISGAERMPYVYLPKHG